MLKGSISLDARIEFDLISNHVVAVNFNSKMVFGNLEDMKTGYLFSRCV